MRHPVEAFSKSYMWCFGVLHITKLQRILSSHLPRYLLDSAATSFSLAAKTCAYVRQITYAIQLNITI